MLLGFLVGAHAAGDVFEVGVAPRLEEADGDGTAVAAAADHCDPAVSGKLRDSLRERSEGDMHRPFDVI